MNDSIDVLKLQGKRLLTEKISLSFRRLGMISKAISLEDCGTFLGFSVGDGFSSLVEANFCRVRLCPMCDWRRSLKIFSATSRILDYTDSAIIGVQYLFLTLTVQNVVSDNLGACIDSMMDAYKRLTNGRDWKKRVLGSVRTLEITYNAEMNDFHPHFHMILAVSKEYGKKGNDLYWSNDEWASVWRRALRAEYQPYVFIERVKGGRHHGIAEVSKYAVKSYDFLSLDDEDMIDSVLSVFVHVLHGRRLVSYTGCFHRAMQALSIADPEAGPLIDDLRSDVSEAIIKYRWNAGYGNYIRVF